MEGNSMQHSVALVLITVLFAVCGSTNAMAQVPVDIQRIDEVYSTITSETNSDSIVDAFAKMLRDNARDLAKRRVFINEGNSVVNASPNSFVRVR